MFRTIKRIVDWCGNFKRRLFVGFIFSFLSSWFAAAPVIYAGYIIGKIIEDGRNGVKLKSNLWIESLVIILALIICRFILDYLKARCHETISYELVARDRLAIGEALKRVSLGYFQVNDTGTILNAITTGLHALENMGIRMVDNFIGGYLNFFCIFLFLCTIDYKSAFIAVGGVVISFLFLLVISKFSSDNTKVLNQSNEKLTRAALEYTRGLAVVKSFGMEGASVSAFRDACSAGKNIALKIEWGFIPYNCLHLLALKLASVFMVISVIYSGTAGNMDVSMMMIFSFLSLSLFASVEPISDSAHVLAVIDNAMNQLDILSESGYIDVDGKDIKPANYNISFEHVDLSYDGGKGGRKIIKDMSFDIAEGTTTAIVGPSGSGKTTVANLIARFYDVDKGCIRIGGEDIRNYTCDSLLSNIAMVFQNVYLFNDTIRANICFGRENVSEDEMMDAAKKARCHDFIMELPNGYDTVIGEGGGTLSGGEKQRISIARAILKDAPIIILDESTASIDPENEHLIQGAITEMSSGKTVIIIAHRLATIEAADKILVIEDGKIAQNGTHDELISVDGKYKEFYEIRKKAENWEITAD